MALERTGLRTMNGDSKERRLQKQTGRGPTGICLLQAE